MSPGPDIPLRSAWAAFGDLVLVHDYLKLSSAYVSGFITKFIQGASLDSCLRFGNLAGAINTTAAGGTGAFSSGERIREVAKQKFGVDLNTI